MDVVNLIIKIVMCVFSLFIIVVVLMQDGEGASSGAFGGGADMAFGKNKTRGIDKLLNVLTKVSAIGFMVLAIALVVIQRFFA